MINRVWHHPNRSNYKAANIWYFRVLWTLSQLGKSNSLKIQYFALYINSVWKILIKILNISFFCQQGLVQSTGYGTCHIGLTTKQPISDIFGYCGHYNILKRLFRLKYSDLLCKLTLNKFFEYFPYWFTWSAKIYRVW